MNERLLERFLFSAEQLAQNLERLADIFEAAFDRDKKAIRLYDTERKKVYQEALAPEVKDKFGIKDAVSSST
jgi:hypothetical protein